MPSAAPEFTEVLRTLLRHKVDFIVVGGLAAIVHGSPLLTDDVDVLYRSAPENHRRLIEALRELKAVYVDPAGRHFEPEVERFSTMKVHLLKTRYGRLDLLRSIGDDLTYEDLLERSGEFDLVESRVRVLDLEAIIETKESADRPKDRHALLFLRQLLHETRKSGGG